MTRFRRNWFCFFFPSAYFLFYVVHKIQTIKYVEIQNSLLTENISHFISVYSRLPVTRTLYNSNLPLTRSNFYFPSEHFLYNFTLDNSNFFLFPLKVRIIGSRLYLHKCHGTYTFCLHKSKDVSC